MQERIRQIMEHYGLSQQNFAAQLGVAPATISSIFTGRTNPTNKHVQAIHKAFPEVDTNWLMFGEGAMMLPTDDGTPTLGADGEPLPTSGGAPSEITLFGDEVSMVSGGASASNVGQYGGQMGANARGLRRDNPTFAPAYGAMLDIANGMDKKPRKIKEIRVFYDDGTFEVFSPNSK